MKRPLIACRTYYFNGEEAWDYGTPLRAMAQWVKRHNEDIIVLGINVNVNEETRAIDVTLTVEHGSLIGKQKEGTE